ncbi:MAG: RecQ family ATP-dependent DNA helicase [Bacteroidetes bacterium]|nr:RecQ family ATP-dependent DNA helicase [Bacteroidota bacterium]
MPLKSILLKYWGYSHFRPLQEDIIQSVLDGKDTLALLPTGGGKSLCFQVPAMAKPGICIVISPLIALMKDQVENLNKRGINAKAIYSGMHQNEIEINLNNAVYGDIKLLYVSPERLQTDSFREHVKKMKVNLIAVDEAHCVSQWGYDFRPPYLKIAELKDLLKGVPLLALTATATPEVVEDIQNKLEFKQKNVFQKSFERKNLTYFVIKSDDKLARLLRLINKVKGTGIVYVRSRRKTIEIANYLNQNGIKSGYYHAGLEANIRNEQQKYWMNDRNRVIVATNAFGMGIDKPNVRFVVHLDIPDTLEAYFQEAGRAGRDEQEAISVILFDNADVLALDQNFQNAYPEKEFIRSVYQALGNYFQIAEGSGKDQSFYFDLRDFCDQYRFNIITAYNALKFLEKEGYIFLNEDLKHASKIHFTISKEDLYRFQIENPSTDNFIKIILRSYGGVFADFVPISELEIAKRSNSEIDKVEKMLQLLTKMQVMNYIPQKDKPFITYVIERIAAKDIFLSKETYEFRKNNASKRIEAVKEYIESTSKCHSQFLLSYFGETKSMRCGKCDICLERNKMELNEYEFNLILEQIKPLLRKKAFTVRNLLLETDADEDKLLKVLQWLLDNDKIKKIGETQYAWN